MRPSLAVSLLAAFIGSSLAGQTWTTQVGLTGGVSRQKPAGTGQADAIDRWELPNSGTIHPALFVIVPLARRIGLESSLAASRVQFKEAGGLIPESSESEVRLTVRADFALTAHVYVAAGGLLRRREIDSSHSTQTGVLAALGYRWPIGRNLDGRIEAQWLTQRQTDSILPSNVYAVLFGISQRLNPRETRAHPATSFTPWRLQVGAAGGYARTHVYGSASGLYLNVRETVLDVPGSHGTTPPPLFLAVPLGGRLALDLGFAEQRIRQRDTTSFEAHIAPRLDVALYHGWYAGAGANMLYVAQTGSKGIALAGASVATGYRISLAQPLEGRVDVSYTVFKQRADFPFAQNTVAALLGLGVPLR